MLVIQVNMQIKPEFRQQYIDAMLDNARGSQETEPGCLLFSVIQDETDPNRLRLFEVYRDAAAFDAHRQASHYLKWRETVKDWYAAPNEIARGSNLYPPQKTFGK